MRWVNPPNAWLRLQLRERGALSSTRPCSARSLLLTSWSSLGASYAVKRRHGWRGTGLLGGRERRRCRKAALQQEGTEGQGVTQHQPPSQPACHPLFPKDRRKQWHCSAFLYIYFFYIYFIGTPINKRRQCVKKQKPRVTVSDRRSASRVCPRHRLAACLGFYPPCPFVIIVRSWVGGRLLHSVMLSLPSLSFLLGLRAVFPHRFLMESLSSFLVM